LKVTGVLRKQHHGDALGAALSDDIHKSIVLRVLQDLASFVDYHNLSYFPEAVGRHLCLSLRENARAQGLQKHQGHKFLQLLRKDFEADDPRFSEELVRTMLRRKAL